MSATMEQHAGGMDEGNREDEEHNLMALAPLPLNTLEVSLYISNLSIYRTMMSDEKSHGHMREKKLFVIHTHIY